MYIYRRTLLPHCPTVLVVENALEDTRFSTNSLVIGFPHIRFYAGAWVVPTGRRACVCVCGGGGNGSSHCPTNECPHRHCGHEGTTSHKTSSSFLRLFIPRHTPRGIRWPAVRIPVSCKGESQQRGVEGSLFTC